MLTLYGYKRCGTCRKAEKLLSDNDVDYTFVDITLDPPSEAQLRAIIDGCDKPLKKFFNTSGVVYREQKIKDLLPTLSEDEQIKLLASNGKLIKRPIITDGAKSSVAYNEEELQIWL